MTLYALRRPAERGRGLADGVVSGCWTVGSSSFRTEAGPSCLKPRTPGLAGGGVGGLIDLDPISIDKKTESRARAVTC